MILYLLSWLCATAAILFALMMISILYGRPRSSSIRYLPGPKPTRRLGGNMLEILNAAPGEMHEQWSKEFGSTFQYRGVFGDTRFCTLDPKALNHILLLHSYDYPKPKEVRSELGRILGKGVLFAEGNDHKRQRRLMNPAFSSVQTAKLAPLFSQQTTKLADQIETAVLAVQDKKELVADVVPWLSRCTLDITGYAGFDYRLGAMENEDNALSKAFRKLFSIAFSSKVSASRLLFLFTLRMFPSLANLPFERVKIMKHALATMESEGKQIIKKKMKEVGEEGPVVVAEKKDVISILIRDNLSAESSKKLSEEELSGQITTIMLAGHETTATAATWAIHRCAVYPEIQAKIRNEIKESRAKYGPGECSAEQIGELQYLDAFCKELLRLDPPVSSTIRCAAKDDTIPISAPIRQTDGKIVNSIFIKEGQQIFIPIVTINASEALYGPDAKQFKPERWLTPRPETAEAFKGWAAWGQQLTFLGGARACIGYRFAILELKIILATLIERFEFAEREDKPEILKASSIVTRPILKGEEDKGTQMPVRIKLVA